MRRQTDRAREREKAEKQDARATRKGADGGSRRGKKSEENITKGGRSRKNVSQRNNRQITMTLCARARHKVEEKTMKAPNAEDEKE